MSVQAKKTHISKCFFVSFSNLSNASLKVASVVVLSWAKLDGLKDGT